MSTRNPQNERYMDEDRKGVTRKSAASAKPKSKAASTVVVKEIKNGSKRKPVGKDAKKIQDKEAREKQSRYYHPLTDKYIRWHWVWLVAIIIAIISIIFPMFVTPIRSNQVLFYVFIGIAYVMVIAALVIDIAFLRKERKRYMNALTDRRTPEYKAMAKQEAALEAQIREKVKAAEAAAKEKGEEFDQEAVEKKIRKECTKASKTFAQRWGFHK